MATRTRTRERPTETDRQRAVAVDHFKRTGLVLPGHQAAIAAYLADHEEAV